MILITNPFLNIICDAINFMHVIWSKITTDNNRSFIVWSREKPSHDVKDCSFSNGRSGHFREDDGRVTSHEEVAPWRWNQGRHQPNQIIIHVT